MKEFTLLTLAILLLFISCNKDNTKLEEKNIQLGNFEILSSKIEKNEPFEIKYTGNSKNTSIIYYNLKGADSYIYDADFKHNKATITVPDSIEAVSFYLKENGEVDFNKGNGHYLPVYDENGVISKNYHSVITQDKMNTFYMGIKKDYKAFFKTLKNEKDNLKNTHLEYDYYYTKAAIYANAENYKNIVNEFISKVKGKENCTEKEYNYLVDIYKANNQIDKSNAVLAETLKKFPNGNTKKAKLTNQYYATKEYARKDSIYNFLVENYPADDYLESLFAEHAVQTHNNGNLEKFENILTHIKSPLNKSVSLHDVAEKLEKEQKYTPKAVSYAKRAVELLEDKENIIKYRSKYSTPNQILNNVNFYKDYYYSTYATLLFGSGKTEEAIKVQEEAIGTGDNATNNENYITYLFADKNYEKVVEKGIQFYKKGKETPLLKTKLKEALLKQNTPKKEIENIFTKIEKELDIKTIEKIKLELVNEKAPSFSLKNLKGETVELSDFKGKTVVLDFWATWCGPCKASFPGMQLAIDKFKNNNSVVFLFINTLENISNREKKIGKYMTDKKYTFNVLFDVTTDKKGKSFQMKDDYNIKSLPTKIIIDPKGNIRYRTSGFAGQNEKIPHEIELIINAVNS